MRTVTVVGLGKVGSLVGTLLSEIFSVQGIDKVKPANDLPFDVATGDVADRQFLYEMLSGRDAVVSCLPYNLNLAVAEVAHASGIHYFDLTEDVSTTAAIRKMAETSRGVMAP
ncbi:MAG: saccharopine dehydrogenase NADP-binding domain-containing protein, partial [Chitinophagaceae bacterium]|nr:saccharopine dehydrogenase NADP-binding domain-containing protein [Chitinophagaceae bacterium]